MKFGQNVTRKQNYNIQLKNYLKGPKYADVRKKSVKKLQILHITLGLCGCKERKNTKAYLI